jgi:hypothetical protein
VFAIESLWLPILASAVAVFVVSSLVHMVLPWHKNDYPRLANEDAVMDALRPLGIPPGEYFVPRPSSRDALRSPEFLERVNRGPVFILNMMPSGMMPMGKSLAQWFVFLLVVSFFAGHIAFRAITPPAAHHVIFHTVGLSAFMGYAFGLWTMSIWYRRPWMTTIKATVDGFIYALMTAEIFVLLWPK